MQLYQKLSQFQARTTRGIYQLYHQPYTTTHHSQHTWSPTLWSPSQFTHGRPVLASHVMLYIAGTSLLHILSASSHGHQ
jgi:hypothetical protein